MITIRRGTRLILTTVVAVVVAVAGAVIVTSSDSGRVTVTGIFADASPLVPGNKVQLYGVEVGTIRSVALEHGLARVTMEVDRGTLPLHTDATAKIMPVSLLGERYIQLDRGTDAAPLAPSDAVIPIERTSAAVDLDHLLNTLDDPTSTALAALVTTLGEGIAGQGGQVAGALAALEPTLRRTDDLSRILDQQNAVIDHLVVQAEKNGTAFAGPLDGLVASTQRTLGTVARNREFLDQALQELPSMLASTQRTLSTLASTANVTTDNLASIRPLTDNLADTSTELQGFSHAAEPSLASLPDVVDKLNAMLDQARPVVESLGPVARATNGIAGSVRPIADDLFRHQPGVASHLENLMKGAADWAMATSGFDGLSHYYAGVAVADPTTAANAGVGPLPPVLPDNTFNPVPPDPNNPDVPSGTGLPAVPTIPRISPPQEQGNSTPPADNGEAGSATGLSPQQEDSMFGQFLGGGAIK
jgi:phospholipid/cholesterol/gamma-HCH transport system substrate-binding protein